MLDIVKRSRTFAMMVAGAWVLYKFGLELWCIVYGLVY